mgnify:CR=1 FL=1
MTAASYQEKKSKLEREIRKLEEAEEAKKRSDQREKNFKKFMERDGDWMIDRAHADLTFINSKYYDDMNKPMIPSSVEVSGNCGKTYFPRALLTDSTKTYFHNVWDHRNEDGFQKRFNEFVQKEIEAIARQLVPTLEMMGLQSNHYYITEEHFPKEKLETVKEEIAKAQKEVLDRYSDKEFSDLVTLQTGWVNMETNEPVPPYLNTNLSHSSSILLNYIAKYRPSLHKAFKEVRNFKKYL